MSIKTSDPIVSTMAKLLGSKGGSRNTKAQTQARKKNALRMVKMRMAKQHSRKAA